MVDRFRVLHVSTAQGYAGPLVKDGQHVSTYDLSTYQPEIRPDLGISLTMPPRAESWKTVPMLPAFQTFMPEGFLRDFIRDRFAKTLKIDDMALLALSGANSIGRIKVATERAPGEPAAARGAESLKEILADQGTRDLFAYLCEKYLVSTSIAGVQPKVVVPVTQGFDEPARSTEKQSIAERSTLHGRELIIKVDGPEYPGLSENEYHCLSIAKQCPTLLRVPAFQLSQDLRRLAIARFDMSDQHGTLGFEDMVALQGKVNDDKYEGSYELVAAAIMRNCSPTLIQESLHRYFASIVLAVALRNGDAHLKNFGLLYTDPSTPDCALSPLFDQVCTTAFIAKDLMALTLAKSRHWPGRAALVKFGREHCDISRPGEVIETVCDAVSSYRPAIEGPAWKPLRAILEASIVSLR